MAEITSKGFIPIPEGPRALGFRQLAVAPEGVCARRALRTAWIGIRLLRTIEGLTRGGSVGFAALALFSSSSALGQGCSGDIDHDGRIGSGDVAQLMDLWGPCAVCDADLNRDGAVDRLDLGLLFQSWGPCPAGDAKAIPFRRVPLIADSGERVGSGADEQAIYSEVVSSPDAGWLRVIFDPARTTLTESSDGEGAAFLRITSLHDGFEQRLDATTLAEWGFTSAYFNGEAVHIELVARGGGAGRVAVLGVHAGMAMDGGVATICGPTDDRCQSSDPRVGRIMPVGCTAWLFDNQQNAMLSAGHCAASFTFSAPEVVQFNVPRSSQDGTPQNPSPSHQYVIDPASVQFHNNGQADDWTHFGVFSNSTTGLSPFAAQGMRSYVRAAASSSGLVRVTGFGFDDGWENQTTQTHVGELAGVGPGSLISYLADAMGGSSGSPILRESDGAAIGIHTDDGCSARGGSNSGTTFDNPSLAQAIANPQGVAATKPPSDLNADGQVNAIDVAILLGSWGQSCTQSPCADLNGDGIVNATDLALQLGAWPPSPNPPSVPSWATLIEDAPDPSVVTDVNLRNAIIGTGLAWRVRDNGTQIEMLLVPPGTFNMGCTPSFFYECVASEHPVHPVTLTCPFYIGRYEVTQAQWQATMGSNPSAFKSFADSPNRPVETVSWLTIQGFLSATGLRLPTEAEWEYTCRAGTTTAFHGGPGFPNGTNDDSSVGAIAWYSQNNGPCCSGPTYGTKAVGQKAANALGLHDTLGNVWEWVNDWFLDSYYSTGPAVNPVGAPTGLARVIRGDSWNYNTEYMRASVRGYVQPDKKYNYIGFRVVRDP
jgi:formylglycine-generating enzyme required for sulfatase activity/V8-like Glu-specific endopeptidase